MRSNCPHSPALSGTTHDLTYQYMYTVCNIHVYRIQYTCILYTIYMYIIHVYGNVTYTFILYIVYGKVP